MFFKKKNNQALKLGLTVTSHLVWRTMALNINNMSSYQIAFLFKLFLAIEKQKVNPVQKKKSM